MQISVGSVHILSASALAWGSWNEPFKGNCGGALRMGGMHDNEMVQ